MESPDRPRRGDPVSDGTVIAVYEDGVWLAPQQSALSMFAAATDEFGGPWPRAGTVRKERACAREPAHALPRGTGRLWPTPAASLPNDGEEPGQWLARFVRHAAKGNDATRAGVPLAVAARAPVVLRVAKIARVEEARELLKAHERDPLPELASRDELNPAWVELLMGFPPGWTETD